MKIVFMGTPGFAVPSLKTLIENGYNIVGVVTAPDKPAGRGQQLMKSEVKQFAEAHHLKILQPTNLKSEEFLQELKALDADLQIVIAFRMLPETVWNMPPMGTYNLHASLLPSYRGAAPINWAIINGEKESGVTTFKLKHEIDTGNILFQERIQIDENMSAGELHDQLMELGEKVILKSVKEIEKGNPKLIEQNEQGKITHAPKIFREQCKIDWNKTALEVHNHIRGLSPYPAAWTDFFNGEGQNIKLKIFKARVINNQEKHDMPWIITEDNQKIIALCSTGRIEILELQAPGKKRLTSAEFLRGFKIQPNNKLL
jgi:methionyl-tRNA formyltransferase